jgi:hypothetical protein
MTSCFSLAIVTIRLTDSGTKKALRPCLLQETESLNVHQILRGTTLLHGINLPSEYHVFGPVSNETPALISSRFYFVENVCDPFRSGAGVSRLTITLAANGEKKAGSSS